MGGEARRLEVWRDHFARAVTMTTTPEGGTGWKITDTSSAGTPTYLAQSSNSGELKISLDATSEVQNVCLSMNDVLPFALAQLQRVKFLVEVGSIGAATTLVFGVASARHDTPDTVATNAWFRMQGSASTSALLVETDDGTTDNDDKATGQTLAASKKMCIIDFTNGLTDVRFFVEDSNGHLTRVATATTFDMSAASSTQQVQPLVQIQKTAATTASTITIDLVEIEYKMVS